MSKFGLHVWSNTIKSYFFWKLTLNPFKWIIFKYKLLQIILFRTFGKTYHCKLSCSRSIKIAKITIKIWTLIIASVAGNRGLICDGARKWRATNWGPFELRSEGLYDHPDPRLNGFGTALNHDLPPMVNYYHCYLYFLKREKSVFYELCTSNFREKMYYISFKHNLKLVLRLLRFGSIYI